MNNIQLGRQRDRQVIELVTSSKALTTEQVSLLMFKCHRIAQERLKRLYDTKKLKRCRPQFNNSYVYYNGKKPGQVDHLVAVNWVKAWFTAKLASWESLYYWEYEPDHSILRADAFTGIKNNITGEIRFWFVEVDLSSNPFDKVVKYNELYQRGREYLNRWWTQHTKRFPGILCVTEDRMDTITTAIERDNINGLQFEARLLPELIAETRSKTPR